MEEMRKLKMDIYQILSEYISDENLVTFVEEIIYLIEKTKQ